ncbi:MAG: hypothetical protein CTY13_06080 [Methylobacter sp.]|nr:MAG: hypothetical protein CTY13_06080 [Methylobacter sp.]
MIANFVKNLIDGAKSVLVIFHNEDYIYPDRKDFRRDARTLSSDFKAVGKDMRRALTKYHG